MLWIFKERATEKENMGRIATKTKKVNDKRQSCNTEAAQCCIYCVSGWELFQTGIMISL
jgi:hypothetical protein